MILRIPRFATRRSSADSTTPGAGAGAFNFVEANIVGNYSLTGATTGPVAISAVNVTNETALGGPGLTHVELTFAKALCKTIPIR